MGPPFGTLFSRVVVVGDGYDGAHGGSLWGPSFSSWGYRSPHLFMVIVRWWVVILCKWFMIYHIGGRYVGWSFICSRRIMVYHGGGGFHGVVLYHPLGDSFSLLGWWFPWLGWWFFR